MLMDIERYEDAEAILKAAVKMGCPDESIYTAFGQLCLTQQRYKEAINQFEELLKLNSNSALAYLGMGMAYWYDYSSPRAADCFHKAIELAPNMPEAHDWLLKAMIYMRQFDQVEEHVTNICQKEFLVQIIPPLAQELAHAALQ